MVVVPKYKIHCLQKQGGGKGKKEEEEEEEVFPSRALRF